jgi:ABC-type branched-subunit amino acid transport system substrate-binding protein
VTKDTVAIGLFYPKTGPYAGIVRNFPAVVQAAFDEAGPINGRRLILKTYDDGTANASTIQVEEKRARNEVFALMSGVGETNVVLAPLADQHKVPAVVANIDEQVALPLNYVFAITAYWRRQAHRDRLRGNQHGQERQGGLQSKGSRTRTQGRLRTARRPVAIRLRQ